VLTDADYQRIRAEEIFRAEVRQRLTPPPSTGKSKFAGAIWDFLNSSVGGWLLTTVLAGFVAWVATTVHDNWQSAQQRLAIHDAVRREVEFRLAAAELVEDAQMARNKLDEVYIDPAYKEWEFGAVLYKLADVSERTPELLHQVLHFKSTNKASVDFHQRLAVLRQLLKKTGLIDSQAQKQPVEH
jgi:hypothetical protein